MGEKPRPLLSQLTPFLGFIGNLLVLNVPVKLAVGVCGEGSCVTTLLKLAYSDVLNRGKAVPAVATLPVQSEPWESKLDEDALTENHANAETRLQTRVNDHIYHKHAYIPHTVQSQLAAINGGAHCSPTPEPRPPPR